MAGWKWVPVIACREPQLVSSWNWGSFVGKNNVGERTLLFVLFGDKTCMSLKEKEERQWRKEEENFMIRGLEGRAERLTSWGQKVRTLISKGGFWRIHSIMCNVNTFSLLLQPSPPQHPQRSWRCSEIHFNVCNGQNRRWHAGPREALGYTDKEVKLATGFKKDTWL